MKDTHHTQKTYLALGDSMSIDEYTGVRGGGAVAQFYRRLQGRQDGPWRLIDRTTDGHRMADIDFRGPADLITMTIGGNDLVQHIADDPAEFVPLFDDAYRDLAAAIRKAHPQATIIVGNVYQPQGGLPRPLRAALDKCNWAIARWAHVEGFHLADIHGAFLGHEADYLCLGIEPSLAGATVIAGLFEKAWATHDLPEMVRKAMAIQRLGGETVAERGGNP